MATAQKLTETVTQGTVYPVPVTILCGTVAPLDDLTGASVAIEVYGSNGVLRTGWTWTETGTPVAPGDDLVGHVTPPAGADGVPNAREEVKVLLLLTLAGASAPLELAHLTLTVKPRSGRA